MPSFRWIVSRAMRNAFLTADAETLDERAVTRLIAILDVVEELAALRNELQEPAARMVVFFMGFEMLGQVRDAFGQNGYLNFRRTGIAGLRCLFLYERLFALHRNRHRIFLYF